MSNVGTYPRGSRWRKWDLHVHTPVSILSNRFPKQSDGSPDWDAYLSRLEQLDVAVLGVTDYFTIDGYKALLEFRRQGRLKNIRCLLPNIEFRLDSVISSRRDGANPRRLNFHVIFSDEVSPEEIEEHFLHDLAFNYEGNPQDRDDQRKLKRSNLEQHGARLIAQHSAFRDGRSPLEIGAMTAVVSHSQISSLLTVSNRFKDRYLLVFPEELTNLISWDGQDHHVRKFLLQKSDMVFSNNSRTINWSLGQPPYAEGMRAYLEEFKTLKPCIHGSDAHALEEVGHPCAKRGDAGHQCAAASSDCDLRYCWIKADPTFEGLRQLIYEPADRVRIQSSDPSPVKSIYTLEGVVIQGLTINDELSLADTDLPLSDGLVAVIGGKGSGKTALVDLIAHCFLDREHTDDRNSFVRRVADEAASLNVELRFGSEDRFSKQLADRRFVEASTVAYIAQGELERYIDEHSDLNEYIHSLIFRSSAVRDTVEAFEYESTASHVANLQADLDARNGVIDQLERATAPELLEAVKKSGTRTRAERKDVQTRIAAAEAKLPKEKAQVAQTKQQAVTRLKAQRDQLVSARELAQRTLRALDTEFAQVAALVSRLNKFIAGLGLGSALPVLAYPERERIVALQQEIEKRLRLTVGEIEKAEKEIKSFAQELQEHARLLSKKEELGKQLARLELQWRELVRQQKQLTAERAPRTETLRQLLQTTVSQRRKYTNIIATFAKEKDAVLADLDFEAEIVFDKEVFLAGAHEMLDNRQVEVLGTERTASVFQGLLDLMGRVAACDEKAIDEAVAATDTLVPELRARLKKSRAITSLDFDRLVYRSYLRVRPVALYKRVPLHRLSLGQKATVLIKIYLAEGTNPIIIDSHDDHLDNEFIMQELVGSIRQAKYYRQVIIVSNNGNMVVNSDAEQVVVADRKGGVISYVSGSLENAAIRERALKVLEGGFEAFKRRQEKYRISLS